MRSAVQLLAALLVAGASIAAAQDKRPELDAARKRELVAKWKALPPEKRAELKRVHAAYLAGQGKETKRKVEKAAADRIAAGKKDTGAKAKLDKVPQQQREQYKALMQKLVDRLPKEERARLAQLPPKERKQAMQALIQDHRLRVLERHLGALPGSERDRIRGELAGVQGQERFKLLRRHLEKHVRERAREIFEARDLAPPERARRLKELMRVLPPEMRDKLRERIEAEAEKRAKVRAERELRDQRLREERERRLRDRQQKRPGPGGG